MKYKHNPQKPTDMYTTTINPPPNLVKPLAF